MATASNVQVGVTGAVNVAPVGTALPTTADAVLNAAFDDVGYVSEDGITQAISKDITDIRAWQNADIVRKIQTSHDVTYAFTMLETSEESLSLYYGNYAAGVVEINGEQPDHLSFVIDVVDGDDTIRIVIPDGQVTEVGDIVYQNGDAIGYNVTVTCFADAQGNKAYKYLETTGAS